ncbi:glutamyl-tRNA reductase [Lewinella sp. 4G2]|uniref:glutamyl-tRNA reductase n=1 Tax=Lewinella sp. 4G2 TaxID=1803372 RepID=UPI0007B49830|nr:glutamyl-tRNA reductase [Lewinella sp. 4G2]OAV42663.1 glutamyl-tRNA reductase [Lewinella sp. 4G2]
MLQHVHLLTLTHRHAKLKDIGELVAAFEGDDQLRERLTQLKEDGIVDELCYMSTCNRLLLLFTTQREVDDKFRTRLLGDRTIPAVADMRHLRGLKAIYHLFEVGSSIDSLVVGERQILGQFRDAYARSKEWGLTGDDLRIICDRVSLASKDVYNNTRIGEKAVSVVSLSMQQLRAHKPSTDARVLMIGAGQSNVLVGKFLRQQGLKNVTVVNRTLDRAAMLASTFENGKALSIKHLSSYEGGFDILIACTGSAEPIVTPTLFHWLLAGDEPKGKLVVDLGVPADVDERTVAEYDFRYVGIEQLRALADENMSFRREEIKRSHGLLHVHLEELENAYRQRLLERALAHLPAEIKAVRQNAVDKVFAKEIADLDPNTRELMDRMLTYMEKRCIGIPMKAAREAILG